MTIQENLAKHVREVFFGGNWTSSNLKATLADTTLKEATTGVYGLNTILKLVYHIGYYITAVTGVLQGDPLTASDKVSFDHPAIESEEDWQTMLAQTWQSAEAFARLIEQLPETILADDFWGEKYGDVYRNIQGIIEHTHYHLGQIMIIKKMVLQAEKENS